MENSKQTQAWASRFGVDYTNRNAMSIEEMDAMYLNRYGLSRTEMNTEFLSIIDRDVRILEVGANIGLQLEFLQKMGFKYLYGIEVSAYAVEMSKSRARGLNIIKGDALDIPFKDDWFDLVFTSGVLIHINPHNLPFAMKEIYRCSSHYIWGFEYYADRLTQVKYREAEQTSDLLWKDNFPMIYCGVFSDLSVLNSRRFKVLGEGFEDVMFLLEKKSA